MGARHSHCRHQSGVNRHAVPRIAIVHHGSSASPPLSALRQGLQRRGLIEGHTCIVDAVGVEGRWTQLPALIAQLLHREPDILVAVGGVAALAAQRATSIVPILYAIVLDPWEISLASRNVSGVTTFDPLQATRHLQLLGLLLPDLRKVACLTDSDAPKGRDGRNPLQAQLINAATEHRLDLVCAAIPETDAELGQIFDTLERGSVQALVALEVPAVLSRLGAISRLAELHRLPMLSPFGWPDGGVVMQGAALHDAMDPLARSVAAVLGGATVGEVSLHTVRNGRLVVNLGRAQRIGLQVPASVLDHVTR